MSRIPAVDPATTQGQTAQTLGAVQKMLGATPNMFRVAAQAPSVLEWLAGGFVTATQGALRPAARAGIALTVAQANGCDYCLSAHSYLGAKAGLSEEARARARAAASDDVKTDAILKLARALVLERGRVGEAALARARLAGVTDAEVLEIIANVALNIFTNYLNIVAETDIDFPVVRAAA